MPLHVNDEGLLFGVAPAPPIALVLTPRTSRLEVAEPLAPVWHTTDVPTPAMVAAEHWSRPAGPGQTQASAHVIVGRDGLIVQLAPFTRATWHTAGPGDVAGRRVARVNLYTVGIEIENIGHVRKVGDAFYRWPYYRRRKEGRAEPALGPDPALRVDQARVEAYGGRFYDGFPEVQVQACGELLRALVEAYGWAREHSGRGHVFYDPERKQDPWPLFIERHLSRVLDVAFPAPPLGLASA